MSRRPTSLERFAAWVVTGPVGRVLAFALDLAAAWWGWLRRRLDRALSRHG